jgi:hypothetical protein
MKIVVKSSEAKLLEIVNGLRSAPDGYYALHYNLSKLREEFRSEYQVKIAVNVLNDLFKAQDSIAFVLADCDIVLLYNGVNRALLEKAIFQLRYLFMDDPLGYTEDGFENEDFCSVYDLEFQWRDFSVACNRKAGRAEPVEAKEEEETLPVTKIATPIGNRSKLHIFSPEYLVHIIAELDQLDITSALRSQPVCAMVKTNKPKVLFKEVYTNISHLQQMLSVNVDLMSSRTLFKYLTKALDKKVLLSLKDKATSQHPPISLNLNVASLLSEEFAEFDAVVEKKYKSSIIIEINIGDVFDDIHMFSMARETVQKLGYRICLDGLDDISIAQIDRQGLGFDLAKIKWNPEMGTKAHENADEILAESVKKCGVNRIILCRCDSQAAVDYGKSIGISLFQGHHIDNIIAQDVIA